MPQAIAAAASLIAKALISVGVSTAVAKAAAVLIVKIAVVTSVSAAANALSKPTDPGAGLLDPGQYTELYADPLSARVILYGESGIAGEIVFQQVSSNREDLLFVIAICENGQPYPHEFTKVTIDGNTVTFNSFGEAIGFYDNNLDMWFYGGTPTQTADPHFLSNTGGYWTSAHRGRGVVYATMRAQVTNSKKFPNGRPKPIFTIKGRRLYDPRKDSTVAGGLGTHRIDDESTWEWSNNAALVIYDFARGVYIEGRRVAGLGMPNDLIDLEWVIASANACDEEDWTIDGPVSCDADPADVLKSFAVHMAGRVAIRRGKFAPIAGYDWPSVGEITEDDLAGKVQVKYAKNWRDVHNAIKASYRDDTVEYEAAETNLITVAAWVEQDNDQVFERSITLPFVSDRAKATRLAKLDLYRRRVPRTIECAVKLKRSRYVEGDFVDVSFPSYGINETYEVVRWELDQAGFAQLTLDLWDASGLDWSEGEEGDPPEWSTLDRADLTPAAPDAGDWTVTGETLASASGSIPAISVEGSPPVWIDAIAIDWRVDGASAWNPFTETGVETPGTWITGLAPGEDYEVSVRYRFGGRYSSRLILSASTPNVFASATSGVSDSIVGQGALATRSTVNASYVDAASLTSDLMASGGALNAADNGNFALGQTGWDTVAGAVTTDAPNAYAGDKYFLTSTGDGSLQTANKNVLFVTPGELIRIAAVGKRHTAGTGGDCRVRLRYVDSSGAFLAATDLTFSSETSYTLKATISTVPANAVRCQITILKNAATGGRRYAIGAVWVDRVTVSGTHLVNSSGVVIGDADIITSSGTAAAIAGQGDLATTNAAALPFGANYVVNSEFVGVSYPPHGHSSAWNGNTGFTPVRSLVTSGQRNAISGAIVGTPANGTAFALTMQTYGSAAHARRFALPVSPGDRVAASILAARNSSLSGINCRIFWLTENGAYISEIGSGQAVAVADGSAGNVDNYTLVSLTAVAPANARYAIVGARAECNGGANPQGWVMSPTLCRVPAGQTAVPPYNPGPFDRNADVSLENTAAAITGQGSLATLSTVQAQHVASGVDLANLVRDPFFAQGASFWTRNTPDVTFVSGDADCTALGVASAAKFSGSPAPASQWRTVSRSSIPVQGGTVLRLHAKTRKATGFNGRVYIQAFCYSSAGSLLASPYVAGTNHIGAPLGAAANETIDGLASIPAGTVYITAVVVVDWGASFASAAASYAIASEFVVLPAIQAADISAGAIYLGASGTVYREDASTRLTDAAAVTALGTASAIVGQAAAATDSSIESGATQNKLARGRLSIPGSVVTNYSTVNWVDAASVTLTGLLSGGEFQLNCYASLVRAAGGAPASYPKWRVVSTDASDGDIVELVAPVTLAADTYDFRFLDNVIVANAKTGTRKIKFQILATNGTQGASFNGGAGRYWDAFYYR